MLLAIDAVDQIEENLRFEVGPFKFVDVVPEKELWCPLICCGDYWRYKVIIEFGSSQFLNQFSG
jgi:hypothetical protein